MPIKKMFMLRGDDGRCRTVMAGSPRGALNKYLDDHPKAPAGEYEVRERGSSDDWEAFAVK